MQNRFKVQRFGRNFIVVCTETGKCTDYILPEWQDAQSLCATLNATNLEMQNREVARFFVQLPSE
jgi:hypothetical protein